MPRILEQPSEKAILGLQCWRGHPERMQLSHWHNELELNLVESGSLCYLFGGAQVRVPVTRLAVFWGAIPHQLIAFEPGTTLRWLTVPLALFLQWQLPEDFVRSVLHGSIVLEQDTGRFALDQRLFDDWESDLHANSSKCHKIALLEMEARFRRLALCVETGDAASQSAGTSKAAGIKPVQSELGKVEQMTFFIAEHYAEPLQIADIARAAGLHPNYAMTLFRRQFGLSLSSYLTQYRISHAQRLLATTDAGMLQIALTAGFGSASRFYAVFKRTCGQSPGQYRASLRSSS
jgi:AraC-like DNA-binding protein